MYTLNSFKVGQGAFEVTAKLILCNMIVVKINVPFIYWSINRPKKVKPVIQALPLRQSLRLMKRDPEEISVPVTYTLPQPQEDSHVSHLLTTK